jgi:hypothetical protein
MPKHAFPTGEDERHEFDGAATFDDDGNVIYIPFLHAGRVGYRVVSRTADRPETFIYFNPSGGSDDGVPSVFVYEGTHGDPNFDGASHHYNIEFPDTGGPSA